MREKIKEAMVNYCKECSSDRYGQMGTIDVYIVFKDTTKEVLEYLKINKLINVSTYGWKYGTYQGIGGLNSINDEEIRNECNEAWANNENRKRNLCQW
jgi:hypothetical protein